MTTLWDTTGTAVVAALAAERRNGGSVTAGLALTLVVICEEKEVTDAEAAVTVAASKHPMRSLFVVRRQVELPVPRLDAEILIGGRLGPGEAIEMRMYGRLALHAESVTLPLLAPDAPVVAWWNGAPPESIANDPLGVFADRRITDCVRADDRVSALRQRAVDYAPGDTDLSWTRITPWRATLASAFDTATGAAIAATVFGDNTDPSALLFAGWLSSRLGFYVPVETKRGHPICSVSVTFDDASHFEAVRDGSRMVLHRDQQADTFTPFAERAVGDLLAEELRRLDADQTYGEALGAVTDMHGLNERLSQREHIWNDPALAPVST